MKAIMVKGNPIDGFHFVGPYDTLTEAVDAGDSVETEWWVAPLYTPEEED